PGKMKAELRRHVYMREGAAVRCKIKWARDDGSATWADYFRVVKPSGADGWQGRKPQGYIDAPYFKSNGVNPLDEHLPREELFITEGEKDADTLADAELCAISCGSQAIDWSEFVKGRHVVIFGDNDEAGRKFAARQAKLILEAAASVKTYT